MRVAGGFGPFTKDQNPRIFDKVRYDFHDPFEDKEAEENKESHGHWTIVELPQDDGTNTLDSSETERGRGFSNSNFLQKTSSTARTTRLEHHPTTEHPSEIKEPVLRPAKKETARSLKLNGEITEPLLRPRATRQNTKGETYDRDEVQEALPSQRGFTVQYLPERLAEIFSRAEKYAKQTLLPLISRYTPSFISGARQEEPKYLPIGGGADNQKSMQQPLDRLSERYVTFINFITCITAM